MAAQKPADGLFAPACLFPGGVNILCLSRIGVLVTVHHAHPDLCPTLQRENITSNAAIKAGYQLQVQHTKLDAVSKRLAKLASEYHN